MLNWKNETETERLYQLGKKLLEPEIIEELNDIYAPFLFLAREKIILVAYEHEERSKKG